MANRSYLYTFHPEDSNQYRDLSEWRREPPLSHLLLVGADARPCRSAIWEARERIAIQGTATKGRTLFLSFLDWLAPQIDSEVFADEVRAAKEALNRPDRLGAKYHLELGEVYELLSYELHEMEAETEENAATARQLVTEVRRLLAIPNSSLADTGEWRLKDLAQNWEDNLGLSFRRVLYLHLGK